MLKSFLKFDESEAGEGERERADVRITCYLSEEMSEWRYWVKVWSVQAFLEDSFDYKAIWPFL